MRLRKLVLAAMTISLVTAIASSPSPAAALSCAPHPDSSPAAIASGTDGLASKGGFFDRYDFAVVGTVDEIRTAGEGEPDYGATTIDLNVVAVLGTEPAPQTMTITSPDPGWMAGYPYESGRTYFIPVQAEGPDGQPNYSFLCDPISEINAGIALDLAQPATDAGIPFSTPGDELTTEPESDELLAATPASYSSPPNSGSQATRVWPIALTLTAVVSVSATAAHLARRRSTAPPA
jgi:hypothetical protein